MGDMHIVGYFQMLALIGFPEIAFAVANLNIRLLIGTIHPFDRDCSIVLLIFHVAKNVISLPVPRYLGGVLGINP